MTNCNKYVILTKKVEAHLEMSIRRAKACAGVAAEKGSGAEGRLWRADGAGGAEKIRIAVAIFAESYPVLSVMGRTRNG